jgi:hypothetical protein
MTTKMTTKMTGTNGNGGDSAKVGTSTVKQGLAQMLKGGVIVSMADSREDIRPLAGCGLRSSVCSNVFRYDVPLSTIACPEFLNICLDIGVFFI